MHLRRDGHGGGIAPAPAQGGHISPAVDALETRHQDHLALVQLLLDAFRIQAADPGAAVFRIGAQTHLPPQQGDGGNPHLLQRHGAEGNGDLLSGDHKHIQLAAVGLRADLMRLRDQVVGGVPLGGEDDDHVVSGFLRFRDDAGHPPELGGIRNGGAAEFLYD